MGSTSFCALETLRVVSSVVSDGAGYAQLNRSVEPTIELYCYFNLS